MPLFFGTLLWAPTMAAIGVVSYVTGAMSEPTAVDYAILILILIPASAVWLSRIRPNVVIVDGNALKYGRGTYPWSEVTEMRIMTFGECHSVVAGIAKGFHVDVSRRCVRVKLRRMARVSFFTLRAGTRVPLGVPVPMKCLWLYFKDPESFIARCGGSASAIE